MWGAIVAAVASIVAMLISNNQQETSNQRSAQWQLDAQRSLIDEQNKYNSPQAQMDRFKQAGLNPHLIYGQGSPGQQPSPGSAPSMQAVDHLLTGSKISKTAEDLQPVINQTRLTNAQVDATNASTVQRYASADVAKMQARLIQKNPLMDDEGFKATIDGLKAAAELKQTQGKLTKIQTDIQDKAQGHIVSKIYKEVELLEKRLDLAGKDQAIKAEIVKSKEFQNEILRVQKEFMTDAEVTPQHIYQFIQLLLMKLL